MLSRLIDVFKMLTQYTHTCSDNNNITQYNGIHTRIALSRNDSALMHPGWVMK